MRDILSILSALQHADSFFPGGGVAFSSGLEGLLSDRVVATADELATFVEGQLEHRWATCDAVALVSTFRAGADFGRIRSIDAAMEAAMLAAGLREGSRRAGASLLGVHARLGTSGAITYRGLIARGEGFGHLPVVQGLVWRESGMLEADCRAASAHMLCTGFVSAALRLGMIGHLDAQRVLVRLRPALARLLECSVADAAEMHAYTPQTEIASMRHEVQDARLFAN